MILGLLYDIKKYVSYFFQPILLISSICIFFLYLAILFFKALNIPLLDDYDLFLNYLILFDNDPFFEHRALLVFGQHNEHRLAFEKLTALIQVTYFKRVNFIHLIYIGNLMLFFSILFLYKQYIKKIPKTWLFFILSTLFFSLNSWESMLWATGALQNYSVLFLCFISFYFAFKSKGKYWYVSFLFSVLALFTSGMGLFTFIIVLGYYFIYEKKYFVGFVYLLLSLGIFYFYFQNYITNPGHADPKFWILHYPLDIFNYIIVFLGNFIFALGIKNILYTKIAGYILLGFSIYKIIRYRNTKPLTLMIILLVLMSVVSAAISRVNFTYIQALSSRYTILSMLLLFVFIVEALYPFLKRKLLHPVLIPALMIFYLCSYTQNIHFINKRCDDLKTSAFCDHVMEHSIKYMHPSQAHPRWVLIQAKEHKIYFMPWPKVSYQCK